VEDLAGLEKFLQQQGATGAMGHRLEGDFLPIEGRLK
jgi:hypothetical protein